VLDNAPAERAVRDLPPLTITVQQITPLLSNDDEDLIITLFAVATILTGRGFPALRMVTTWLQYLSYNHDGSVTSTPPRPSEN
jgi:hypothetical protein